MKINEPRNRDHEALQGRVFGFVRPFYASRPFMGYRTRVSRQERRTVYQTHGGEASMNPNELPETIAAGEVREVQVCPLGSFENVNADGKRRTQLWLP